MPPPLTLTADSTPLWVPLVHLSSPGTSLPPGKTAGSLSPRTPSCNGGGEAFLHLTTAILRTAQGGPGTWGWMACDRQRAHESDSRCSPRMFFRIQRQKPKHSVSAFPASVGLVQRGAELSRPLAGPAWLCEQGGSSIILLTQGANLITQT